MYSAVILLLALANAAVLALVFREWWRQRSTLLLILQLALAGLVLDTAVVGSGALLGPGEPLATLSVLRFFWLYMSMPLLLIVFASMARSAGLPGFSRDWLHGAFCLAAVGGLVWALTLSSRLARIYPACWQDSFRYVLSVRPDQVCFPGQEGVGLGAPFPWFAVIAFLLFLLLGLALWWRQRWPWLALGIVAGIGISQVPAAVAGPLAGYAGEALCLWAVAAAALWLTPVRPSAPPERG
ncbi:MAG: hypothetical protein JJT85_10185 [Chromatiales bacterium]|nr:hypothetical protein [Chromatiales bacterium]